MHILTGGLLQWCRGRTTALHRVIPGLIPSRLEILNFSLGLELGGMVEQNLNR